MAIKFMPAGMLRDIEREDSRNRNIRNECPVLIRMEQ